MIDAMIPLLLGVFALLSADTLVKDDKPNYLQKRKLIRAAGGVLILVGAVFVVMTIMRDTR